MGASLTNGFGGFAMVVAPPAFVAALCAFAAATPAYAGEAEIIAAEARQAGDGTWTVSATIRHADEGWDHYSDAFEVLGPNDEVLATRILHHPHVDEQPFTRSISGVAVPDGVVRLRVRARDSVHGYGSEDVLIELDPDR